MLTYLLCWILHGGGERWEKGSSLSAMGSLHFTHRDVALAMLQNQGTELESQFYFGLEALHLYNAPSTATVSLGKGGEERL